MSRDVHVARAAVVGAGVMGAGIAAHLANAGIDCLLLDLKPRQPTPDESARGLDLHDPRVANRLARTGIERVARGRPPGFFSRRDVALVTPGNLDDDLARLGAVDWVIEAVIEKLDIKRELLARIAPALGRHTILSTNTSGISIAALADALPASVRPRFLATHFFNPPRYLKLLELVPGPDTDPGVIDAMGRLAENELGKGVVVARDTPNFIANRIGVFALMDAVHRMIEDGYSITEVDALTGSAIGRPKSATFRTADVVGLDTLIFVADGMADRLPHDRERDRIRPPDFVREMAARGLLGEKAGGGFYRRVKTGGGREIHAIDPGSLEYRPQPDADLPALRDAGRIADTAERVRALVASPERGGDFLWKNLGATMRYAATCLTEISDDIVRVDDAMRWGFGWELGPFELWDAVGVESASDRMRADGESPPPIIESVLGRGGGRFYDRRHGVRHYFDPGQSAHVRVAPDPRKLSLIELEATGKVIEANGDAALFDLGAEVAALVFRTKMGTITPAIIDMINRAIEIVERDFRGLVIGGEADNFSAGANLQLILDAVGAGDFDRIETVVKAFQDANQRLRFSRRPVVVAPRGLTLGGGCEITMSADRVCAAAETYIGLPEVGAGVVPSAGGCKEMIRRTDESVPDDIEMNLFPLVRRVFETVGMARVAGSAREAMDLGFLRRTDRVIMNADFVLREARETVLGLDREGYRPPRPRTDIRVPGAETLAIFRSALYNFGEARQITPYDRVVGERLAWVLCGGDLTGPARVSEQYLLDLERQAFLALCRDRRTQDRMAHLLRTGKPLRN